MLLIKNRIKIQKLFSFHARERIGMMRELLNIDPKKANIRNSIASKTLKLSDDISAVALQNFFNNM